MPPHPVLARDLPFPVARLWRQSRNAKSSAEAHNRAWFAWELSIRLAVVGAPGAPMGNLRAASVGDWVRAMPLDGRNLTAPELLELHAHAARVLDPSAGRRASVGKRELLDALVAYRNRVIGHGPSRDDAFCSAGARILRDALAAGWAARLFLPEGARLVHVEGVEIGADGRHLARVLDLGLETPTILEPEASATPRHVVPHRVYLREGDTWTDLSPWLVFDGGSTSFFVFQSLRRRPEYLEFSSGAGLDRDELARLAPGAEAELLRVFSGPASPEVDDASPARGARRFGDYEILGELGRGGMGVVHLANQVSLARLVALKTLPEHSRGDPVLRARFHREIEALARCDHPNVVKIHASGEHEGVPYFAMEFVSGTDLRRVGAELTRTKSMERALDLAWQESRAASGPLAEFVPRAGAPVLRGAGDRYRAAATLIRDAALGVQALHDAGVIHRDISPSNILVTSGEARAVVMDLGLALLQDGNRSLSRDHGQILGTLRYMSPEQLQRNLLQVDRRADVYSLGAVLYELLSDKPFFDGDTEERLIAQVLRESPVPVRSFDRRIPRDLALVVEVATDKEPRTRYATAAALASDLSAFLESRPIRARPRTIPYVVRKWVARHPVAAFAAILAIPTALAANLGFSSLEAARAYEADRRQLLADARQAEQLPLAEPALERSSKGLRTLDGWITAARDLCSRAEHYRDRERALSQQVSADSATGPAAPGPDANAHAEPGSDPAHELALVREVLKGIDALAAEGNGTLARVERDRKAAAALRARTVASQRAAWDAAITSIADPRECPAYAGAVKLTPQEGLVPLGRDPTSGLWEFEHVLSASTPAPGDSESRGGIVLVLLPAGVLTRMPREVHPDLDQASARGTVQSPVSIPLSPFFISKYEVTQTQWKRMTGRTESANSFDSLASALKEKYRVGESSPADDLSWERAEAVLRGFGLVLPTEAQWEYAARAGSAADWSFGDDAASFGAHGNVADASLMASGVAVEGWEFSAEIQDGFVLHAPVGSFRPNPFGLFDVHGNVMEFCAEPALLPLQSASRPGDGLLVDGRATNRPGTGVLRGGAWCNPVYMSKLPHRYQVDAQKPVGAFGVRPARSISVPEDPQ